LGEKTWSAGAVDRPLGRIYILAAEIVVNLSLCDATEQHGYSHKRREQKSSHGVRPSIVN